MQFLYEQHKVEKLLENTNGVKGRFAIVQSRNPSVIYLLLLLLFFFFFGGGVAGEVQRKNSLWFKGSNALLFEEGFLLVIVTTID